MKNRCNVGLSYSRFGCGQEATMRVEILDGRRRGGVSHMCMQHARSFAAPTGYIKSTAFLSSR
jgi:hypothetical protein